MGGEGGRVGGRGEGGRVGEGGREGWRERVGGRAVGRVGEGGREEREREGEYRGKEMVD